MNIKIVYYIIFAFSNDLLNTKFVKNINKKIKIKFDN